MEYATRKDIWEKSTDKRVFVVPAFEIKSGHSVPSTKADLLVGVKGNYIRPFYNETCYNCHKSENFDEWEKEQTNNKLDLMFEGTWNANWEPFYIGRRK